MAASACARSDGARLRHALADEAFDGVVGALVAVMVDEMLENRYRMAALASSTSITLRNGSQLLRDRRELVATLAAFESAGTSPEPVHFGGSGPASRPMRATVSRRWPVSRSICRWVQPMLSRPMTLSRSFMLS